jgi:short-subunit dehydrogenase
VADPAQRRLSSSLAIFWDLIPESCTNYLLRLEAQQYGVKVSTVCPGRVKSEVLYTNPIAGITKDEYIEMGGVKVWDASKAAKVILRDVEKNKPIIAFPFYCRVLWRIHRYLPPMYAWMNKKSLLRYRSIKSS